MAELLATEVANQLFVGWIFGLSKEDELNFDQP